jgi:hypothetical protein
MYACAVDFLRSRSAFLFIHSRWCFLNEKSIIPPSTDCRAVMVAVEEGMIRLFLNGCACNEIAKQMQAGNTRIT